MGACLPQQFDAGGCGGEPGLGEQVAKLPQVDLHGGRVDAVAGLGVAFEQVAAGPWAGGAAQDVADQQDTVRG
jgi:hypothetical protein